MIEHHGKANAKLKTVAGEQKLKVPTTLDAQHRDELGKLKNAQPPVHQAYLDMQRKEHADAIKLLKTTPRQATTRRSRPSPVKQLIR